MWNNIIDRIKLPFRKDRELISSLYEIMGFYPHDMRYYKLALMHKSVGHRATAEDCDSKKKGKQKGLGRKLNNERLEFLGDGILDAIVGDVVYRQYPGKAEGFLTNTRSKLVKRETLGKLAQQMGISKLILSSCRTATHNSYMGGNAFEALVGAMYLDRGYDACYKFWNERVLGKYIDINKMASKEMNFKSKLIEWAQKNRMELEFRLDDQTLDESGSPVFNHTIFIEGIECEKGKGFSKKESHQLASEKTLRRLKTDSKFVKKLFDAKSERTKMDEDMFAVPPTMPENIEIPGDMPDSPAENDAELAASNDEEKREDIIAAAEKAAYESGNQE